MIVKLELNYNIEKYEIKSFSFRKDNIDTLDCSDVDNRITKKRLFGEALVLCTLCEKASLPYSAEEGISLMLTDFMD